MHCYSATVISAHYRHSISCMMLKSTFFMNDLNHSSERAARGDSGDIAPVIGSTGAHHPDDPMLGGVEPDNQNGDNKALFHLAGIM